MTKTGIIKETAGFYNSESRGTAYGETSCFYVASNGNKCAVGRCLINPERWAESGDAESLFKDMNRKGLDPQEQFSEQYRGHDEAFWLDLQGLHDKTGNWNENGLTEIGKEHLDSLLEDYFEEIG